METTPVGEVEDSDADLGDRNANLNAVGKSPPSGHVDGEKRLS
jgi:hypothetical protein